MKLRLQRIPALLAASILAFVGLVVFQLSWMRYSRQLSEELFNQRARMALCSAVENYGGGVLCAIACDSTTECCQKGAFANFSLPFDLSQDTSFRAALRRSLNIYQIQLDYELSLTEASTSCDNPSYQSVVYLPGEAGVKKAYLQLNFPGKEAFVQGRMNEMVLATVLILLFTALVLFYANWALHKQKRLLRTNVDFFNNMAHEFRTPLTNMTLATNMLSKKHPEWKDNHFIDIIRRESAKLLSQVERVLHLARLDNGDYALQKEPVQIQALLQSVIQEMDMQVRARGAQVSLQAPAGLEVLADRMHLGNVFRNLLDNALKYCNETPVISIIAEENASGVVVSVQDNGIGIPSGHYSMIFEKFQRVGKGDVHEQKGFGLGLAYVKSMVELHKGSVRVSSEPNTGSRFEVFLPVFTKG